jgi:hypothetical protein
MADSDASVICRFMEPQPYSRTRSRDSEGGWWRLVGADRKSSVWEPTRYLTLDLLHQVEERLTPGQCSQYERELYYAMRNAKRKLIGVYAWHASAEQKIRALAVVLRAAREGGSNG